jgi:hypothetical protein
MSDSNAVPESPIHVARVAEAVLVLWENRERVLACPRFAMATDPWVLFGFVYGGSRCIAIADLIDAWARGELLERCPHCDGTVLVCRCGSGLSFSVWSGICRDCRRFVQQEGNLQPRFLQFQSRRPSEVFATVEEGAEGLEVTGATTGNPPRDLSIREVASMLSE